MPPCPTADILLRNITDDPEADHAPLQHGVSNHTVSAQTRSMRKFAICTTFSLVILLSDR